MKPPCSCGNLTTVSRGLCSACYQRAKRLGILDTFSLVDRRVNVLRIGQRFGRGVVIAPEVRILGERGARLRCDCGQEYVVRVRALLEGAQSSCGCLRRELVVTHGLAGGNVGAGRLRSPRHPHYGRWQAMIARCEHPTNAAYKNYGGRGIIVCDEWHDPLVFIEYLDNKLGPCPEGYSMDRIDNDGGYEPGNIRWASASEQSTNQRKGQRGH